MDFKKFLVAAAFMVAGSANAVVLSPTNQNVNFFNICFACDITGLELGIFDDSVVNFGSASWLSVNVNGDVVDFSPTIGQNTNYSLTNNANNSLILSGNDDFQLLLRRVSPGTPTFTWAQADSVVCSANTESCTFGWNLGTTELLVDVELANPVPVPAAFWLMGSGLLGLVGVARRRHS